MYQTPSKRMAAAMAEDERPLSAAWLVHAQAAALMVSDFIVISKRL